MFVGATYQFSFFIDNAPNLVSSDEILKILAFAKIWNLVCSDEKQAGGGWLAIIYPGGTATYPPSHIIKPLISPLPSIANLAIQVQSN